MKGKIEITFPSDRAIRIRGNYDTLDETMIVILFDKLAEALELTDEDRLLVAVVIAGGGIEALGGPKSQTVRIGSQLMTAVEAIKNRRKNNNETDALYVDIHGGSAGNLHRKRGYLP